MLPFWVSRGTFQAALKMAPAKMDYWHDRSMMCSSEDKPGEISQDCGVWDLVAEINLDIKHGGGLYFICLPPSKAPRASTKAE